MNSGIHKTAIIEKGAKIGKNVKIGAYCVIGKNVKIGDETELKPHIVIEGQTTIGQNNVIYPFTSIGTIPQDLKFAGEESEVIIGDKNIIREHVTINPGTKDDAMVTKIGNNCLLMVGTHIAHDCQVGNHCIFANNATLAGHVIVEDHAIVGGLSAVHQFVRIGKHAMIGGMSGVEHDVIPYGTVKGNRASLAGLNLVGMRRRNIPSDEINKLLKFFKAVFESQDLTFEERLKKSEADFNGSKIVKEVLDFLTSDKKSRSICKVK
ncbi:acyl-ACP--UDP-N-acetylglucosamine O-acyltransferase [Pseudomonadota bacterium]